MVYDFYFTTSGVATPSGATGLVDVQSNKIHLKCGNCPGHYEAAKSTSGLAAVELRTTEKTRITYRVRSYYRKIKTALAGKYCEGKNYSSWSGEKTLSENSSIGIRAQKAGDNKLWGKEIELLDAVIVEGDNGPPPSGPEDCIEGTKWDEAQQKCVPDLSDEPPADSGDMTPTCREGFQYDPHTGKCVWIQQPSIPTFVMPNVLTNPYAVLGIGGIAIGVGVVAALMLLRGDKESE